MRAETLRGREELSPSVSSDFDRDVELYLRRKDDLTQTQSTRTTILQKKLSILEAENNELRAQIDTLEREKRELMEELQSVAESESVEEMKVTIERLQAEIREKDKVIGDLQTQMRLKGDGKRGGHDAKEAGKVPSRPQTTKASHQSPLWSDIRKELNRNLSPRSVSLEQKMQSLRKAQPPVSKPLGSPEFMADLSRKYENMLAKYDQKASKGQTMQINAIKEQLGATGKQLSQMIARPVSAKQLPKKQVDTRRTGNRRK